MAYADTTYTIRKRVRRFPKATGWNPYTYWAAVGDDTGMELFTAPTKDELVAELRRVADDYNGSWHGMSYEQYQSRSPGE